MTKQIKIDLDEAKSREIFKKSFSRFQENMKIDDKPEKKFFNWLTVGVCVVAVVVVLAGYLLLPIDWDILATQVK